MIEKEENMKERIENKVTQRERKHEGREKNKDRERQEVSDVRY